MRTNDNKARVRKKRLWLLFILFILGDKKCTCSFSLAALKHEWHCFCDVEMHFGMADHKNGGPQKLSNIFYIYNDLNQYALDESQCYFMIIKNIY